jgi:YbgC/YbaW family acyl-CoA thioester hydrolase
VSKGFRAVVVNDTINYAFPAKYNDRLSITCWIEKFGTSSINLGYTIIDKNSDVKIIDANTTIVCIDNTGKPTPIPSEVKEALSKKA